jgi:hypothetical protein
MTNPQLCIWLASLNTSVSVNTPSRDDSHALERLVLTFLVDDGTAFPAELDGEFDACIGLCKGVFLWRAQGDVEAPTGAQDVRRVCRTRHPLALEAVA